MIDFAYYLLKVFICSSIFFIYYRVALQGKEFHQWNRFYLLAITLLSLLIPCFKFSILQQSDQATQAPIKIVRVVSSADDYVAEVSEATKQATLSVEQWSVLFYTLTCVVFALLLIHSLLKIRKIIHNHTVQAIGNIKLVEADAPGTPFSFFRYIFWNPDIDLQTETGQQILEHEMIHVQQKHTLDKMFMQSILVLFWCNPIFWLIRKELSMIHEFIADQRSVGSSGATALAAMILQTACPGALHHLTNPFFKSSIKRRLAMLTKNHDPRFRYITRILALPVLAIVGLAFTLKTKEVITPSAAFKEPITVVIDAGHGYREGSKPDGIRIDGITEDDLVLQIAKRIKDANSNKDIRIILTREDKNIVDLHQRVKITTDQKADLFISLHANAFPPSRQTDAKRSEGIEIYVSKNNAANLQQSELLGSALISQLKPIHNTFPDLMKREKVGIYVLDKSPCPAVMIECGYMTNPKDLDFIKKEANQQSVAQAILNAITIYAAQINSEVGNRGLTNAAVDKTDTIPQPSERARNVYFDTKQKIAFEADNITVISEPNKTKVDANKALFIINGERVEPSILLKKTIISKNVTMYPEDNPQAIKLYGEDAKRGVIVFNGATFIDTPNRIYYKPIFDKAAKMDTVPENKVFEKVEVMPQFPGGKEAWQRYMQKQSNAAVPITNGAPKGTYTVTAKFIVDQSGNLSAIEPITKNGYGMEDELIRLLKKGPKWVPAKQNGHIVTAYQTQTITFVVAEEDGKQESGPDVITKVGPPFRIDTVPLKKGAKLTASQFAAIPIAQLIQADAPYPIKSCSITIPVNQDAKEFTIVDGKAPAEVNSLLSQMKSGDLFTIERRIAIVDSKEKKLPALIYYVQ